MQRFLGFLSFVLVCLTIIWLVIFFGGVHVWAASLGHALGVVLLFALATGLMMGMCQVRWTWIDLAVLAFLAMVFVAYLDSVHEFQSRQELLMLETCGIGYYAARFYFYRTWNLEALLGVLVILGTGVAGYAIWQHFSESNVVLWREQYIGYWGRASGTYICPNHFAGLVLMIVPLTLSVLIWSQTHRLIKIFLGYSICMMGLGLYFSYSRGGLLSLIIALAVLIFLGMRKKGLAICAIGIAGAILIAGVFYSLQLSNSAQSERFVSALSKGESSRPHMWRSAWEIFQDNPWFGVGPMMYDTWHAHYRGSLLNRATYVHNDYLHLLADYGIVGGILMLAIVVLLLIHFVKGIKKFRVMAQHHQSHSRRVSFQRAFFVGTIAAWVGVAAHLMVDFDMHIFANAFLMSVLIGLAISFSQREQEEDSVRIVLWRMWGGAFCLIGIAAALAFSVTTNFDGEYWRLKAVDEDQKLEWKTAEHFFSKAVIIDARNSRAWDDYLQFLYKRAQFGVLQREQWTNKFFQAYQQAAPSNPMNYLWRVRKGEMLDLLSRFEEAEKEYRAALAFDPNNPYFLSRFGLHFQKRGMQEKAQEYFSRAAQLSGDEATANENLKELKPM
jgi:O-antigen ligase